MVASLGLSFNDGGCDTGWLSIVSLHFGFKHFGFTHKQFVSTFDCVSILRLSNEPIGPGTPGGPDVPAIPGGPRIPGGPIDPGFPGGPGGPGGPGHIMLSFLAGGFGFNFLFFFGLIGGAMVGTAEKEIKNWISETIEQIFIKYFFLCCIK